MRLSARFLGACALSLIVVTPSRATAQQAAPLAPRVHALTTQPINVIVGFYNLEYERAIGPSTSVGVQANFANSDFNNVFDNDPDERYASGDVKLRYYPSGRVLTGFSIGATLGVANYSSRPRGICFIETCNPSTSERVSTTGAKLGFELDYNWLLGADEKFIVALGVGAKRFLADDRATTDGAYGIDYPQVYPTARIAIGFAW